MEPDFCCAFTALHKKSAGRKKVTFSHKQNVFYANQDPLIPIPPSPPSVVDFYTSVFLTTEHYDSPCSVAQPAQFIPLPLHFRASRFKANTQ